MTLSLRLIIINLPTTSPNPLSLFRENPLVDRKNNFAGSGKCRTFAPR